MTPYRIARRHCRLKQGRWCCSMAACRILLRPIGQRNHAMPMRCIILTARRITPPRTGCNARKTCRFKGFRNSGLAWLPCLTNPLLGGAVKAKNTGFISGQANFLTLFEFRKIRGLDDKFHATFGDAMDQRVFT